MPKRNEAVTPVPLGTLPFAPRGVAALAPGIEERAAGLVEELAASGPRRFR